MGKLEEYRKKRKFGQTPEPSGQEDVSGRPEPPSEPGADDTLARQTKRREILRSAQDDKGRGKAHADSAPNDSQKDDGRKRGKTRLPAPKLPHLQPRAGGNVEHGDTFVVQKHRATRLHYDFRLAIDGTLKSWAVPKGPSQNRADKRLAVMTEDHPLDYANFEGNIPAGNYGAGTVMVWDRGIFHLETAHTNGEADALKQLAKGEIKFSLNGEKLRGSYVLVRLKQSAKGNEWLMIKHKDSAEDAKWNIDEHDGSVLTGRTIEEIKEELPPKRSPAPIQPSEVEGATRAPMPSRLEPMLASLAEKPFSDPRWLFEIKWDGVRALAWIEDGALTLRSRHEIDMSKRYPELAGLPGEVAARQAILDGEIVALDEHGHSNFQLLQERMHVRAPSEKLVQEVPAVYFIFDLIYCDGYDLRDAPLLQRKQLLQKLLRASDRFRFSDHQIEHGKELYKLAGDSQLEGILAKRADSRYSSGRSNSWLKMKITKDVDAVIGGWTAARTPALPLGSLLLGLYDGKKLRFIGHAGSGFGGKKIAEISTRLKKLEIGKCPFEKAPETNEKAYWISPQLVARVKFSAWTQEQLLRHPVFIAIREDARPEDCQWKQEVAPETESAPAEAGTNPDVVRAPEVVDQIIKGKAQIEAELFKGRRENITIELDGKRLRLSNLNKVYFPESGYTKRDLLAYYYRMADYILPFLRDRALVLRRYPDGIRGQTFFQKDVREGLPEWFKTTPIHSDEGHKTIHYATADDLPSLLFLTGLGCIDHNPWTSRIGDLEHPDYFFFDLDPSDGTEFSVGVTIARALCEKLDELKLAYFMKTSGATGIHIYAPVEPVYTYEQLRTFGEIIARTVAAEHPMLVTSERIVAKRPAGRILIDVQQNSMGKPLACAYSVRAFPKAPVSTPIEARELKSSLKPESFNIRTIFKRLKEKGDLWADFWKKQQRLESAIELLSQGIGADRKKTR